MFFPESEAIVLEHQDLQQVVELVDEQLSEIYSSAPLRAGDLACVTGADLNQVESVFSLLAERGMLLREEMVECDHCPNLMSAVAFRQAIEDEDDIECSSCGRRFRRNTSIVMVYRMAAHVAARPRPVTDAAGTLVLGKDADAEYVFRREGREWLIKFRGTAALMPDSRGLSYIARLLAEPQRDIPAVILLAAVTGIDHRVPTGSSGRLLTDETRAEYGGRLSGLQEELQQAQENSDIGRIDRIQSEMEALGTEIARATGLSGRKREATDAERVRKAVSNAVARAINRFDGKKYKELVQHLTVSISSGRFFRYDPEQSIDWLL